MRILKPERCGLPLVQEKYREEKACDKKHNNNNNNNKFEGQKEEEEEEELVGTVLRPIWRSNKSDYWIFVALFI